jgi:DICT domain-containing protein
MDTMVWNLDEVGSPCSKAAVDTLEDFTFYGFDADAMVAFSHAIEDLALDEANGFLLASFQDAKRFEPQRERYWQLAATIDEVHVMAVGKKPRPQKGIKFFPVHQSALASFWVVLYQGRRAQAMVIGRQTNDAVEVEERRFAGFYSFDSQVISRTRQNLTDLLDGRSTEVEEYLRLRSVDQTAKLIGVVFRQEQRALEDALGRWQIRGDHCPGGEFLVDLDQTLAHFQQLKERLSKAQPSAPPAHV